MRGTKARTPHDDPLAPKLSPGGGEGVRAKAAQALTALRLPDNPFAIGVSGGSDSIALMDIAADWTRTHGREPPIVLIVDHGLRAGASKEAAAVVRRAGSAGLAAHVLGWKGAKPKSNIEGRAREARYRLMGEWCRKHGVGTLLVGHTRDDQAETFLLRLMRGSGVDGLAAMRPRAPFPLPGFGEVELARPLLSLTRAELRDYLSAHGASWIDDPMNADSRFARSRLRALWPVLESAGLTRDRVADAAAHLARAREALEIATAEFLSAHSAAKGDIFLLDGVALAKAPREIGLRVLAAILMAVGGHAYRPRFDRLEALYEDAISPRPMRRTLHGCRVGPAPKPWRRLGPATLMIAPEPPRAAETGPRAKSPQNRHIPAITYV